MSNGIYLTLEQYKDKDLPITITINGHTYHSQFALATAQTTYFEMGKQYFEMGKDKTYSEKEMSRYGHAWYDEGYADGYKQGKQAGKKANGYTEDDIKQLHTDNEFTRKVWYDKGKAEGYAEGKADGYAEGKKAGYDEGYDRGFMERDWY